MLCLTLCMSWGGKQVSLGRGGRINIWLEVLSLACQRFCVSILYDIIKGWLFFSELLVLGQMYMSCCSYLKGVHLQDTSSFGLEALWKLSYIYCIYIYIIIRYHILGSLKKESFATPILPCSHLDPFSPQICGCWKNHSQIKLFLREMNGWLLGIR